MLSARVLPRHVLPLRRALFSTQSPVKPSIKLVAEIRKRTETSLTKAREALTATNNDLEAALKWLEEDLAISGAKKASKLSGRTANEGLVGVSVLSRGWGGDGNSGVVRAAMIELNCETDFVARNELFSKLCADLAWTIAFHTEASRTGENASISVCDLDALAEAPLFSHLTEGQGAWESSTKATVSSAIRDSVAKLGEKISLRRAVSVVSRPSGPTSTMGLRVGSYVHGASGSGQTQTGRVAAMFTSALKSHSLPQLHSSLADSPILNELASLERSLGRQIVGHETLSVLPDAAAKTEDGAPSTALCSQPFIMHPGASQGATVQEVLQQWSQKHGLADGEGSGLEVTDFRKWTVGEALDS